MRAEAVLRPEPVLRGAAVLRSEAALRCEPVLRTEAAWWRAAGLRPEAALGGEPALRVEAALLREPVLWSEAVLRPGGRLLSVPALGGEPVLLAGLVLARREAVLLASATRRPGARRVWREAVARVPSAVWRVAGRSEAWLLRRRVRPPLVKASPGRIGGGRPEPVRAVPGLLSRARLRGEAARTTPWRRGESRWRPKAGLRGEARLSGIAAWAGAAVPRASCASLSTRRTLRIWDALAGEAGWRLVEVTAGGTLTGVAALLPLRECDGIARGVGTRRATGLLPLVARLLPLVAGPGLRVAARHPRA